jgi:hypothetical protein
MFYGILTCVASIVLNLGIFYCNFFLFYIKRKISFNIISFIIVFLEIAIIFLITDGTIILIGMLFVILASVSLGAIQIIVKNKY